MLHALVIDGELRVSDLSRKVGMKPQAVSNQLQKLVDRRVLSQRRNGANIYYSISDPCVIGLLAQGLCLVEDSENNLEHEKYDETE
jgi:DNA-binding transcriptional ArsR family regulator